MGASSGLRALGEQRWPATPSAKSCKCPLPRGLRKPGARCEQETARAREDQQVNCVGDMPAASYAVRNTLEKPQPLPREFWMARRWSVKNPKNVALMGWQAGAGADNGGRNGLGSAP
jgi:hypothetical protein